MLVGRVEKALARVPGVRTATVNLATESAAVELSGRVPAASLADAVERTTLPPEPDDDAVNAFLVSAYRRAWGWRER